MAYWNDKVALVTGASAGLGFEIAAALCRQGARVIASARDQRRLDSAAARLRKFGGEVLPVCADVTNDGQVEALVATAVEHFGRLDALLNNVGQSSRCLVLDATPELVQRSIELNLLTAVRCTRAASEHLLASGGHIVNVGSLASKTASPYMTVYSAGKFALAAYTHQLRLELGPRGVHVLLACPGPIRRDDAGSRYDEQTAALPDQARKPGGGTKLRGLDPADVARRILRACERRRPELVIPAKARILFILAAAFPSLGDWLLRRMTDD
ncbi:MAG: SDR family NAD(P)-dependent oxidoreductase [Pirellulaceae bacterium]